MTAPQAKRFTQQRGEKFQWGPRRFDIDLAKTILSAEGPARQFEYPAADMAGLLVIVAVDETYARALSDDAFTRPLIAITDLYPDGSEAPLIVDGYHRIRAAVDRGWPTLTVQVLSRDQSTRIEIPSPMG